MSTRLYWLALASLALACADPTTEPQAPDAAATAAAPELAVAANPWIQKADMPSTERWGFAAATVTNSAGQSILYTIGGSTATGGSLSKVQAYNVATNVWTYRASLPIPLYWSNGAGVIKNKIYISGGLPNPHGFSAALYVYDPAKNVWARKRDMPDAGFRGVTGVINNKLYVVTDCEQEDCGFLPTSFYRYDPATDQWATLPAPPGFHGWAMGGVIGGKFYVTGSGDVARLDMYDPATNRWTAKKPLAHPRWLGAGTAVAGKFYVIGGLSETSGGITVVRTTSIYDPVTDSWVNKAALPDPRYNIPAARVFLNGQPRIEVVGGRRPGNNLQYVP